MKVLLPALSLLTSFMISTSYARGIPKIIGGERSNGHDFFLQLSMDGTLDRAFCGSTAIAPGVAVTAAHCVAARTRSFKLVHGIDQDGVNTIKSFEVNAVIPHPQYNGTRNDIALIFFDDSNAPQAVVPVDFNRGNLSLNTNTEIRAIGRGNMTSIGTLYSSILFEAKIPFIPTATCANVPAYRGAITSAHLCAGELEEGGLDSCQGDSGGPLVAVINGRTALVGVTNFGLGCGQKGNPGVYASTAYHAQWIDQNIRKYRENEIAQSADISAAFASKCHIMDTIDEELQERGTNSVTALNISSMAIATSNFSPAGRQSISSSAKKICEFKVGNNRYSATVDFTNFGKIVVQGLTNNRWYTANTSRQTDSFYQQCVSQSAGVQSIIAFGDGGGMMNINGNTGALAEIQASQIPGDSRSVVTCKAGRYETDIKLSQSAGAILVTLKNHINDKTKYFYLSGNGQGSQAGNAATLSAKVKLEGQSRATLTIKNSTTSDLFTWELTCNKDFGNATANKFSNRTIFYHTSDDAKGTILSGDSIEIDLEFATADLSNLQCALNRDYKATIE